MARTIEKSYLAELGFDDLDKKSDGTTHPEHDRAIEYLTLPEVAAVLAKHICPPKEFAFPAGGGKIETVYTPAEWQSPSYRSEVPIIQQERNFRRFICFLDSILSLEYGVTIETFNAARESVKKEEKTVFKSVLVEVKVHQKPTMEIVRQINLQREFIDYLSENELPDRDPLFLAATRYPISDQEVKRLRQERITHVTVGTKFAKWLARQRQGLDTSTMLLEV